MIGGILGMIFAVIWSLFLRKLWVPQEQTEEFYAISYSDLKRDYSSFTFRAKFFYVYFFIYAFSQFLIFALWLFYILDRIRPNISENFEANLVGFLFFQSMVLNLSCGIGIFGYFFKIYALSRRGVSDQIVEKLGLDKYLLHFYILGEDVPKKSLHLILITFAYYLVIHGLLLLIWS